MHYNSNIIQLQCRKTTTCSRAIDVKVACTRESVPVIMPAKFYDNRSITWQWFDRSPNMCLWHKFSGARWCNTNVQTRVLASLAPWPPGIQPATRSTCASPPPWQLFTHLPNCPAESNSISIQQFQVSFIIYDLPNVTTFGLMQTYSNFWGSVIPHTLIRHWWHSHCGDTMAPSWLVPNISHLASFLASLGR